MSRNKKKLSTILQEMAKAYEDRALICVDTRMHKRSEDIPEGLCVFASTNRTIIPDTEASCDVLCFIEILNPGGDDWNLPAYWWPRDDEWAWEDRAMACAMLAALAEDPEMIEWMGMGGLDD